MPDQLLGDTASKIGIGFAGIGAIALAAMRFWRLFSTETKSTELDRAESKLFESLRTQIQSLDSRIKNLEESILALNRRYREAQDLAVEIYLKAASSDECVYCGEIKELARKIFKS